MKRVLLSLLILTSFSAYAQSDRFEKNALAFVKSFVGTADRSQIETFLNDSLHGAELETSINYARKKVPLGSEELNYKMLKIEAPIPVYNINLYHPNYEQPFGDFRILYSNEDDLLIDRFEFFDRKKIKEDPEEPDFMPPPPPTPASKK